MPLNDASEAKSPYSASANEPPALPTSEGEGVTSLHVYGREGALFFEADRTRNGRSALKVEAARVEQGSGPQRVWDWKRKLSLQIGPRELPAFTTTVLGLQSACRFDHHGDLRSKSLHIEHQGSHLYVRVGDAGRGMIAVRVDAPDCFHVAALCLRQLMQDQPWLDATGLLALLKQSARMFAAAQTATREGE